MQGILLSHEILGTFRISTGFVVVCNTSIFPEVFRDYPSRICFAGARVPKGLGLRIHDPSSA